jgi:hypothetical protein
MGDQTHAASLPIYSFAEPPVHTAEAAGAEATGATEAAEAAEAEATEDAAAEATTAAEAAEAEATEDAAAEATTATEDAEAKAASRDPGAVSLAMKTPLFTFMRRNASASNERLHFGPCPNTAFASQTDSTTNTVNIPKALRSTFSHTSTSAACVGSPLRSAKGTVILEAAARFDLPASQSTFFSPTDDLRSFVRLDLKLCMLPQVDQVQFFLAVAHFDAKALAFQSYDGTGARGTSNFVIENTFRYLHDKTLVVVLGLLLPSTIEAPVLPFDANRLIAVAEKRCGVWCGFCVGGLSLVPVGEEKGRGLAPSQEILPLEAKDEAAVLRAGAALLSGSKPLDDSIVIFCPPGAASSRLPFSGKSKLGRRKHALVHDPPAARQTTVRPLPANPPGRKNGEDGSSSGGIIGGGADSKRSRAPDVPRTQPPKKKAKAPLEIEVFDDLADDDRPPSPAAKRLKPVDERCNEGMVSIAEAKALSAAAASSAEAALYKDLVPQLREDAAARCAEINTATALSREHELKVGAQTMSLVSIFAQPRYEGRSPLAAPPVVYQRMGIEEACEAAAAKEAHATKMELMAKNHPEGGIVHRTLVKKAEEARAEAAGIMGAAF